MSEGTRRGATCCARLYFNHHSQKEHQMTDNTPFLLPSGDLITLEGPTRKRGAPRGNKNAIKHGFYSHTFSRKEIQRLDNDVDGEFRDEEEYLHVPISYTHLRAHETRHD